MLFRSTQAAYTSRTAILLTITGLRRGIGRTTVYQITDTQAISQSIPKFTGRTFSFISRNTGHTILNSTGNQIIFITRTITQSISGITGRTFSFISRNTGRAICNCTSFYYFIFTKDCCGVIRAFQNKRLLRSYTGISDNHSHTGWLTWCSPVSRSRFQV